MQEDINRQTISLCIKSGKITASVLKSALMYVTKQLDSNKKKEKTVIPQGKQTLSSLTKQNYDLTNIQVSSKNIGSFDRIARKYDIDYALKKDSTTSPPRYYVFFKAKDVDVMNAAFKEYIHTTEKKQNRPSVKKKLQRALETVKSTLSPNKLRKKKKELER